MRIALLGADDEMLAVAAVAVNSGHGEIVLATEVGIRSADLFKFAPKAQTVDDWEQFLDGKGSDVVFVAAGTAERRVEQMRRLIQVGMPVLLSHPISMSMLECYELDMIRAETHSIVFPYLPARWHPAADDLQTMIYDGGHSPIGPVEQVVLERFLADRSRESVLRQFARDTDFLQNIAGEATKLHALGSVGSTGPYLNLGVQLTCERETVCRWTVAPIETESGARVTLVGSQGKCVLWMPGNGAAWHLELRTSAGTTNRTFEPWDPAAIAVTKLQAVLDGEEVDPTWTEAARTVELAETIELSLKRGRTIDLHREEFSDIGTFKGTMASVGCGILMAGLALVVLALMVRVLAVQAGWDKLVAVLDFWPYLLLGMLGLYLLLQSMVLIGKPSNLPNRQGKPDPQADADR